MALQRLPSIRRAMRDDELKTVVGNFYLRFAFT